VKNSNEEISFIKDISCTIKNIDVLDLSDSCKLEEVTDLLTSRIELTWKANLKQVKITKHSKSWWNKTSLTPKSKKLPTKDKVPENS